VPTGAGGRPESGPSPVSQPDLFVVCKNCGAEVSPYVTECPYCGQRVRKRAPKIDRDAPPPRARRRLRPPSLPRLRGDEIPGIAPESLPVATIGLILLALAASVVAVSTAVAPSRDASLYDMGALYFPLDGDWWRVLTAPFLYDNAGYEFVALVSVGIFGTHLERRFGPSAPVLVFLLAGAAGVAACDALELYPTMGGNGAALGVLSAWFVNDRLAHRRGEDRGNDMLGVAVIAAVLIGLSAAEVSARLPAAGAGAAVGALAGLVMTLFRR
jgi:membrane associated rhomboid family serine protease